MTSVAAVWRYPLKSARGERLHAAEVERNGLRGDRTWACIDAADGTIGSAKHPRRWGALLDVVATLSGPPSESGLVVQVDGRTVNAGTEEADTALSDLLDRPVRLTREIPAEARVHRTLPSEAGMVPGWLAAPPGQDLLTRIGGIGKGRFVDFGPVHLLTTGALSMLGGLVDGTRAAAERFRPNLVLDTDRELEPGEVLRIGEVMLQVSLPTPRCIVPSLGHAGLPAAPEVLRALARQYRIDVIGYGRAACFGWYAEVIQPGQVRVGDPVRR